MHYYQHHIGDFLKDTANLDDHQLATYLRMIWSYYGAEKPFEDDCEGIAFAVRSDEKTVRLILKHYFELAEDGWHHNRCDREIEQYKAKAGKARESANARWKNAKAMRPHSECSANETKNDANQEPITNNQEPVETPLSPTGEKPKPRRKARLPDQFMVTKKMWEWAQESAPAVSLKSETENFCDYWRGQGGTKEDWEATWRTWMRKAQKDSERGGRAGGGFKPFNKQAATEENNARVVREIMEREAARMAVGEPDKTLDLGEPITLEGEFVHAFG